LEKRSALLLVVATLSLAIIIGSRFMEKHEKSVSGAIHASLGMSIGDVERSSQVPVKFMLSASGDGYAEYHGNIPHDLKVVSGKFSFVLPGMQSLAMQGIDGKLQYVDDRPSASLMFLDNALRWSDSVIQVLDQSGWRRDTDSRMTLYAGELGVSFPSAAALRNTLLDKELAIRLKRVRIATWRNGREFVKLEIARNPYFSTPKGDLIEDQVYFTTIQIGLDQSGQD
jgi:hypothetical protein